MRTSGLVVVSGIVGCVAVWMVVSGWRQPRPSLGDAMRALRTTPSIPRNDRTGSGTGGAIFGSIGRRTNVGPLRALTRNGELPLRLIDRPVDVHVGMLVCALLAGFVVPGLVLAAGQLTGAISIVWFVPLGVSMLAAAAAAFAVHADALSRADSVRVDLRHQLGAFVDIVTMLLAGNSGYEGALDQAARAGDGMLFQRLRRRMREVAATGRSLVDALSLVADEFGLVELEQIAATAALSAQEGAPVARSLAAKCSTLRSTLAADDEASARVRTDKVTPPLVGMALLFMALIIYPALNLT